MLRQRQQFSSETVCEMTGAPSPKVVGKKKLTNNRPFCFDFCTIFRWIPRPWDVLYRYNIASFTLLHKSFFLGTGVKLPNLRNLKKKEVHLYRSTQDRGAPLFFRGSSYLGA